MPSTSAASANISPVCESFISPYSTQTSYKNLSELLNRRLTIAGKSPQRTAQLSLLDLLKALDLRIGAIKGSTALQWPAKPTSSDLDMQFAVIDAERVKDFPRKIADFMEACCTNKDPRPAHTHEKQWLAKVAQEMRNQWSRLIVSVGYPGANTSTLDLNFTNQRTLAYDAIHASKALQFDVDRRNATILNSWHPSLVKWVQKNKLLWFNPEIDEGLNRISYRLSKS
ncbi:MAG TPA: hypothetical protein VFV39_06995, partial [Limnobacter sp.]|nr:hypothetical protein [Limnobacter sp.]